MEPQSLPPNSIDLWCAWLVEPPWPLAELESVLSLEERHKAAAFAHLPHRQASIASRGMLRMLLASYLGCAPETIPLRSEAQGKPMMDPAAQAHLEFSVTHTRQLVLYAIARCPVGIDVEYQDRRVNVPKLMDFMLGASEHASVAALPSMAQNEAALRVWAGKEAVYKATGGGAWAEPFSVDYCEVMIRGEELLLTRIGGAVQEPPTWRLAPFEPAEGYIGALCYPAAGAYEIRQRWFQQEEVAR